MTRINMGRLREIRPGHPLVRESDAKHAEAVAQGQEGALQRDAETWLRGHGYWPRTPKMIDADSKPPRGWYIHLHQAKGNPILLDLLIVANDGRWLEIELKTSVGDPTKEQAALLAQDPERRKLCRTLQEVIDAVREWEKDTSWIRAADQWLESEEGVGCWSDAMEIAPKSRNGAEWLKNRLRAAFRAGCGGKKLFGYIVIPAPEGGQADG